jgi:hypothetical protein
MMLRGSIFGHAEQENAYLVKRCELAKWKTCKRLKVDLVLQPHCITLYGLQLDVILLTTDC